MAFGIFRKVRFDYYSADQRIWACISAQQVVLFALGVGLLVARTHHAALAQLTDDLSGISENFEYNIGRLTDATNILVSYLERSFGALVMTCAGLGAILSSAFGQYRSALGCLIIAVGSFILRSVLGTFFSGNYME